MGITTKDSPVLYIFINCRTKATGATRKSLTQPPPRPGAQGEGPTGTVLRAQLRGPCSVNGDANQTKETSLPLSPSLYVNKEHIRKMLQKLYSATGKESITKNMFLRKKKSETTGEKGMHSVSPGGPVLKAWEV